VELLVATSIIILILGGAVAAVAVSLRSGSDNKKFQVANLLVQELLDNLSVLADADWHRVDMFGADALSAAPAAYHLTASAPFSVVSGAESIVNAGVTYSRYFMINPVSRDSSGAIESAYVPANVDPSTIRVTSRIEWGSAAKLEAVRYLARARSRASLQTDWSGGAGQTGLLVDPGKYDSASAGIDVTGKSGSIRLAGIPYP
jgi:type II secretory pathway pseudopilin PulG